MRRPSINKILAANLGHFMRDRGMTQMELAKRAGLGQTTISLYLNPARRKESASGKEPSAKLAEVLMLADALGVELWELLRPRPTDEDELQISSDFAQLDDDSKATVRRVVRALRNQPNGGNPS